MTTSLTFRAGRRALQQIQNEGFSPDSIKVIAGAAGVPKFLVLTHLDRVLFGSVFSNRKDPLFLLGSSIGSWRFAAACRENASGSIEEFSHRYVNQRYSNSPTRDEISDETERILQFLLRDGGPKEILSHPSFRINIMAVRCRRFLLSDRKAVLMPGVLMTALANLLNRRLLGLLYERVLFFDARNRPPFYSLSGFPIRRVPLTEDNLDKAILASGAIPLVMRRIMDIPGAGPGIYRDGGIIDYHPDIPFFSDDAKPGLVLYPHFGDRVISGWFDKNVPWRKARHLDDVVMISPSRQFLDALPGGNIPDRKDFYTFIGQDSRRIEQWNHIIDRSQLLADELHRVLEKGILPEVIRPL